MNFRFHHANLDKHKISTDEVEECFDDSRKIVRASAGAFWLVGKTQAGRLLEIGFVKELVDGAFVFHAMNAKPYQRKQYKTRAK
jgi:uncharacterized DUF497 family protein